MTERGTAGLGRARAARWCALGAAVGAVLSAVGLVGAGAAAGASDYLSQLGVDNSPNAGLYRGSVWMAALAITFLAVSVAMSVPAFAAPSEVADDPESAAESELSASESAGRLAVLALGNAAALLAGAAPFFVASGAIRCSPGCPLPPYDAATTVADIVHAGVSALGFACAVGAMYVLARGHSSRAVRLVSAVAAGVVGGAVALTGIAMMIQSHGVLNGIAERTATVAALIWLAVVGFRLGLRPSPPPGATDDAGSTYVAGRAKGLARVPTSKKDTVHE